MSIFDIFRKKKDSVSDDTAVVPEGHRVVVIHPCDHSHVFVSESGLIILDLGKIMDLDSVFSKLEEIHSKIPNSILWIIQDELLLDAEKRIQTEMLLQKVVAEKAKYNHVSQIAVFPLDAGKRVALMSQFKEMNFGVHHSAEDGACFVEVHKPNNEITVGFPGPVFEANA